MKKIKKKAIEALEYKKQHPLESFTYIGKLYNVDRKSLSHLFNDLMIDENHLFSNHSKDEPDYLYYFTDEEIEMVKYYASHSDEPYSTIKEKYPNCPNVRAIRNQSDILGYKYSSGYHYTYTYDRNKFNEINTEEDAYWLGFITADGCIVRDKTLQIKLASVDEKHLIKFLQYMGFDDSQIKQSIKYETGGAYNKENPVCGVHINSVNIVNNLKDKGITERKSGKEKPYICKNKELEKSYIRGLIDGDGCLGKTRFFIKLVGSQEICTYFKDFIKNNVLIAANSKAEVREKETIYEIQFSGKNLASEIINYLYKDSNIYLDRKYQIYLDHYSCRE